MRALRRSLLAAAGLSIVCTVCGTVYLWWNTSSLQPPAAWQRQRPPWVDGADERLGADAWPNLPAGAAMHCRRDDTGAPDDDAQSVYPVYSPPNLAGAIHSNANIVVFVASTRSLVAKELKSILDSAKFPYTFVEMDRATALLNASLTVDNGQATASVFIFHSYRLYANLPRTDRLQLDEYCKKHGVGLILLVPYEAENRARCIGVPTLHLQLCHEPPVQRLQFWPRSRVLRIAKPSAFIDNSLAFPLVTLRIRSTDSDVFEPILTVVDSDKNGTPELQSVSLLRTAEPIMAIVGGELSYWPVKVSLLDALRYVSSGRHELALVRYLQIDIDDIFVAPSGSRIHTDDVHALLQSQRRIGATVPGFTYTLGFSGGHFGRGDEREQRGDRALISHASQFCWFPHMWKHEQAHKLNSTKLVALMTRNRQFAQDANLTLCTGYSVAPHHSGVYPVHRPLYDAWAHVWHIDATSTEQYPHLKGAQLRRGFMHRGSFGRVKVVPRQTCDIYTHTNHWRTFPGGHQRLLASIHGGQLFSTVLLNPFLVFMTHHTNYGNDRLAPFAFENALRFAQCHTRLRFVHVPPATLARKYFESYPGEMAPVWTNPCEDNRHMEIWSGKKEDCQNWPGVIIVGPQKTGTTALHRFLSLHNGLAASKSNSATFEELQFFGTSKYYEGGIEWYLKQFENVGNRTAFEKSATYFDSELAPKQIHALLPNAKIIVIVLEPGRRAYSWYQHQVAKGNGAAGRFSFEQVLFYESADDDPLRKLRQRCLKPGKYAKHLNKWLEYFKANQIMLVDGEQLASEPTAVLHQVQRFIGLTPIVDYSTLIRYDERKGFYCPIGEKCLGAGKGRKYADMSTEARNYLDKFYLKHNVALAKLVRHTFRTELPMWLDDE